MERSGDRDAWHTSCLIIYSSGPSIKDVRKILGVFDPPCPHFHATSLNSFPLRPFFHHPIPTRPRGRTSFMEAPCWVIWLLDQNSNKTHLRQRLRPHHHRRPCPSRLSVECPSPSGSPSRLPRCRRRNSICAMKGRNETRKKGYNTIQKEESANWLRLCLFVTSRFDRQDSSENLVNDSTANPSAFSQKF